jgi:hypothetical protein
MLDAVIQRILWFPCFPTAPPCFYFFPENLFYSRSEKINLLSPSFAALIRFLKVVDFNWGFKTNFHEKNLEWQRENMATSSIIKSFEPKNNQ